MAAGTKSNFQIYEEQFFGGFTEVLQQNVNAFNEASRGAILLTTDLHRGDFLQKSFMTSIAQSTMINRRDTTSVAATTDQPLAQDEEKSPKLSRRIGPIANTVDSFRKIAEDPRIFSLLLGRQIAVSVAKDMLNSALRATEACLDKSANTEFDASDGTLATSDLIDGLAVMGDAADDIVLWVMRSKQFFDLTKNQISAGTDGVSNFNIQTGTPVTMSRPVLVTDAPPLRENSSPDVYICLGLTAGAVSVIESEAREIASDLVTGLANLVMRIQGELAYTVNVKGWKYGSTANPTDANLATSANWTQAVSSIKSGPGVRIYSQ